MPTGSVPVEKIEADSLYPDVWLHVGVFDDEAADRARRLLGENGIACEWSVTESEGEWLDEGLGNRLFVHPDRVVEARDLLGIEAPVRGRQMLFPGESEPITKGPQFLDAFAKAATGRASEWEHAGLLIALAFLFTTGSNNLMAVLVFIWMGRTTIRLARRWNAPTPERPPV